MFLKSFKSNCSPSLVSRPLNDVHTAVRASLSSTSRKLHTMCASLFFLSQTLRLADFMMKKTMGFSGTPAAAGAADGGASPMGWTPVPVTPPRPLDLALSPASLRAIATAEVAFDQLVDDHEVHMCAVYVRERRRIGRPSRGRCVVRVACVRSHKSW